MGRSNSIKSTSWIKGTVGFILVVLLWQFYKCLPEPLFNDPISRVVKSSDGRLLHAQVAPDGQWRMPASDSLPSLWVDALLTFEDKRFYHHPGVDPLALCRAIVQNFKAGRVVSGGSTITMQLARMASGNPPRTLSNKLKEMIWSLRMELRYTKAEILILYAAHAPFGGNVVGLEAAAWRYFGLSPHTLTPADLAMLAVLPNAPALIHPAKNREALRNKRNHLLKQMYDQNYIDQLAYELALLESIPEAPVNMPQYALHYGMRQLAGPSSATIDFGIQKHLNEVASRYGQTYSASDIQNLAIVVVDNRTQATIGYVGNVPGTTHEPFVDMAASRRSSGSILKPLLYAAALDRGVCLPNTLLPDIPISMQGFKPQNYNRTYEGAVPADQMVSRSLNIPAVHLLQDYGVEDFLNLLGNLGLTTLDRSADDYGLSLILGGGEVTLEELVATYSKLAYQLYDGVTQDSVLGDASVYQMFEAMSDLQRPNSEGHWERLSSSRKLAWKTGTSFGHRDAWALGVSPEYTIGVWVGNADGEGKHDLMGYSKAAPVLFETLGVLPTTSWWLSPLDDLEEKTICAASGMIANSCCPLKQQLIPYQRSASSPPCTFHKTIWTDPSGYQVHKGCEPNLALADTIFSLPAKWAFYYKQYHPEYRTTPSWRPDCQEPNGPPTNVMALIYPHPNTKVYLPTDAKGDIQHIVCKAAHQNMEATIYWHLDGKYLGTTYQDHQWKIQPSKGLHTLMLMDQQGHKIWSKVECVNDVAVGE